MDTQESVNHRQFGQGIIEYALILVLIVLVAMVALKVFGGSLGSIYSQINSQIAGL